MKKIKEGLINEEIVRKYHIREKEVGQEVMNMGTLLLKSWGTLMQICLEGADVRGIKPSFVRDKTRRHSPTKEEEIVLKKSDKFI